MCSRPESRYGCRSMPTDCEVAHDLGRGLVEADVEPAFAALAAGGDERRRPASSSPCRARRRSGRPSRGNSRRRAWCRAAATPVETRSVETSYVELRLARTTRPRCRSARSPSETRFPRSPMPRYFMHANAAQRDAIEHPVMEHDDRVDHELHEARIARSTDGRLECLGSDDRGQVRAACSHS